MNRTSLGRFVLLFLRVSGDCSLNSQGTGADYTEFSASIARRLLPFPDSPLRAKNPDMPVEEKVRVSQFQ
jgi:hypothetical protein